MIVSSVVAAKANLGVLSSPMVLTLKAHLTATGFETFHLARVFNIPVHPVYSKQIQTTAHLNILKWLLAIVVALLPPRRGLHFLEFAV
jgi:hypothetical protein